jgi:thiol-disulfide isomerase/thioredoxin
MDWRKGFMDWRKGLSVLIACGIGLACGGREEKDAARTAEGEPALPAASEAVAAPDFHLSDLSGKPMSLSDLRGKTVVIDFWATWCPPCVFQVPELNKFWQANKDAGDVTVIGVAVDAEGASVVAPWVKEQGVQYPILLGSETLAKDFGALGFPTLVVVRPDGKIDSLHVGLIELAELEKILAVHRSAGG